MINVLHGQFNHLKCYMIEKNYFYDNAVIKVYDIPIFYIPKLAHPDPTVDRRSGFLPPTLYDTKNLGEGIKSSLFFCFE